MINVLSIFNNRADAEGAFDALEEAGINRNSISVVMRKDMEQIVDRGNENAALGATSGAVAGGLAGLLIGLSVIVIPGIGPLVVGGPIVAALGLTGAAAVATTAASGVAAGAVAGGLVGSLVGLGLTEEDAEVYESRVKKGGILINVETNDENMARKILASHNAAEIHTLKR